MLLEDLANNIDINITESLQERFMGSRTLYVRFLRKLLATQDFELLQQAVQQQSWQEALRLAHNLKGVCANLGLEQLQAEFAGVVKLLRTPGFTLQQLQQLIEQLCQEWNKTLTCIEQLRE